MGEDAFDVQPAPFAARATATAASASPTPSVEQGRSRRARAVVGSSPSRRLPSRSAPAAGRRRPQVRRPVERAHAFCPSVPRPHGIGDEDVAQPGKGEHLRLPERADGQSGRTCLDRSRPIGRSCASWRGVGAGCARPACAGGRGRWRTNGPDRRRARGYRCRRAGCRRHPPPSGRATTGDRSSPSRSIRSTTSSPGSR